MPATLETTMKRLTCTAMTLALLLSGCSGGASRVSDTPSRETTSAPPPGPAQPDTTSEPPRPALPRPTTENQPTPRTRCSQQVCMESTTFGDMAEAWSISVDHAVTASNLCAQLSMRCESHPYANEQTERASIPSLAARQRCLRAVVEDTCAHTNCQADISESDRGKCFDRLQVATCPEMLARSREFMACTSLPAATCERPERDPLDPSRQNICEGVAEQLIECGYPDTPDGCQYIAGAIKHCMAQSLAAEKWQAVASCMDPREAPEPGMVYAVPCSDTLACIRQAAPELVE